MSISDIHIRAQDNGSSAVSTTELYAFNGYVPHVAGKFRVPESYNVQNKNRVICRQQPQTSYVASTFLDGGEIEFKIKKDHLSTLTHAYVAVKMTNTTGASLTVAPTPLWIDRAQIFIGGKSIAVPY
eukprot:TRINITY_DN1220_c0_g1_i12.p1 TRINITY_DN1220_c0_g1~~TRINITY_DN1220_c0_g1_i12.p1  ORF type:complete len:127 (+),score=18.63 TRINITY_DN1220_c0_g1_i12:322-702(+)